MNLKEFAEKYGNKEVEEAKLKDLLGITGSNVWKPRPDDSYWYADYAGNIYEGYWNSKREDLYRYSMRNCHKTKEEAIFARDKQIFMTKLERDFVENSEEIDWEDECQTKYGLVMIGLDIKVISYYLMNTGIPVTANREWLENYIKENKADVKKYYFGRERKQNAKN